MAVENALCIAICAQNTGEHPHSRLRACCNLTLEALTCWIPGSVAELNRLFKGQNSITEGTSHHKQKKKFTYQKSIRINPRTAVTGRGHGDQTSTLHP